MTIWQAIVLGVVEGVTEYLPVSSTGHLLVANKLLGLDTESEAIKAYTIVIQGGAILAVLGLYLGRVKQMIAGLFGRNPAGLKLAINILIAFVPAVLSGLFLEKKIDEFLLGGRWGVWPVVIAWIVGGLAILWVGMNLRRGGHSITGGRSLDQLPWQMALVIGLLQCVAMWPGVSRSLMTIVAGIWVGLSLAAAVEFSFLLGVVTLTAAAGYKALKHHHVMIEQIGWAKMAIGVLAATVAAVLAVEWMVGYLKRRGLGIFGWYRVGIGLVVAVLILSKVLE